MQQDDSTACTARKMPRRRENAESGEHFAACRVLAILPAQNIDGVPSAFYMAGMMFRVLTYFVIRRRRTAAARARVRA
jgi:hypothetical protein